MNWKFYKVGGIVRDALLGVRSKDLDLVAIGGTFKEMEDEIIKRGGKIFISKPEYLTVRCNMPDVGVCDIALARYDGSYSDGRRPDSVVFATSIEQDLARRDFTMNAIAQDCGSSELIDPHGGRDDIRCRIVKCVGDADARMAEDLIRPFRAIRFAVTKGFTIHGATEKAIVRIHPSKFSGVSTERIVTELGKMFRADSFDSFYYLFERFPNLGEVVCQRGTIWFEPTTKSK